MTLLVLLEIGVVDLWSLYQITTDLDLLSCWPFCMRVVNVKWPTENVNVMGLFIGQAPRGQWPIAAINLSVGQIASK